MGGHTGVRKTHWKVAARYWWLGMTADIKKMVMGFAYCRASNMAGHEAQQKILTVEADEPFDVIAMDV